MDTGWGLERILAFLNGTRDVYRIDLFAPVIAYIEKVSGTKYEEDEKLTRSMRILADHIRTIKQHFAQIHVKYIGYFAY